MRENGNESPVSASKTKGVNKARIRARKKRDKARESREEISKPRFEDEVKEKTYLHMKRKRKESLG